MTVRKVLELNQHAFKLENPSCLLDVAGLVHYAREYTVTTVPYNDNEQTSEIAWQTNCGNEVYYVNPPTGGMRPMAVLTKEEATCLKCLAGAGPDW